MAYALMGGLVAVASVLAGCFVFCLHRWFRSTPTKVVPTVHQHSPAKRIRPRERDDERTKLLKESSEESENGEGDRRLEPATDTSEQLITSTPVDVVDIVAEKPSSRAEDKVSALRQSESSRRDSYGSTETTGLEAAKPAPVVPVATDYTLIGGRRDKRGGVVDIGEELLEPVPSKEDGRGKEASKEAKSSTVSAEVEPALIDLETAGSTVRDLESTTKEDHTLDDVFGAPVIPQTVGEGEKKQVGIFGDEEEAKRSQGIADSAKTDLEGSKGFGDSVAVLSTVDQEEGKTGMLFTKRVESATSPTAPGPAPAETAKESVADKLTTLTQQPTSVEAQREEREAVEEDAQAVPKLPPPPKVSPKPSPLARKPVPSPQIAPKPSPRPKRPPSNSSTSPDPSSTPIVPEKPVVQPRKLPKGAVPLFPVPKGGVPVFPGIPKGAVPVLPMGGFPALRKTAQGNSDNSSEVRSSGRLHASPWMSNGSSAAGGEGEGEIGTSFEEPIKAPDLYSPSKDRVRGPANRRRPSRH